ncbi:CYTH and CHAD domain-containing protein [Psychrobacter sp. AOP22-C1-22]|uniref:CYTH and CHAD domain-containing protein n=1 Tax=unclassified Psychrobacter TaxID=196806 RepID=UPI00178798A3|nr:CYTH and CHAD domain-containing protein [Psychrobacter sp. FME6]MBE0405800.1 CYTH and CHAD domain-containing protein [Psychrobacter sp. FME6]
MQEIELKFLVPESRLQGLMRQAKVKSSQVTQLAAHYYDTPDQQLAQAGIGLRIRKEGDTWVQTIKAGGDGIAARLEHNAILDSELVQAMLDHNELMPDLTIYKDTSVAPALEGFKLKKLAKKLNRLYVTDVERTTRVLVDEDNEKTDNRIEMAYDYGDIIHGNDDTQRDTIQEIEFELLSGDLDFLFATAKTWCKRYKLCLSTVTKAERGGLLINAQHYSPAVSADLEQLNIHKKSSMPAFARAAVHNCLLQILPNSSAIVAGSTDNEHTLQLRIGINRLRAAIKAFASFSDELNPDWQPILKQTANLLGDYRELTYLINHIEPKLRKNGAPNVDWTADIETLKVKPIDAVSANDFQLTLLELIAFTMSDPKLEPQADTLASDKLSKILAKQYKKFLKADREYDEMTSAELDSTDSKNIDSESIEENNDDLIANDKFQAQHKLRRQLKDLRYISEFVTPLLNKKEAKKKGERWLKDLKKADKTLGQYRDHMQYQQCYQLKSAVDSNALYGAGWFAAMRKKEDKRTKKYLAKVQDSSFFDK